jgi:dihydrofolate reductase
MRKLIVQMQTSADGFQANATGGLDWLVWNWADNWTWDEELKKKFNGIIAGVDYILLSSNIAEEGFIDHWSSIAEAHPNDPQFNFAKKIKAVTKVVFSKSLDETIWPNTWLAKGNLVNEVNRLKEEPGNDMIVFGGITFVTALIKADLIDEIQLFINPPFLGTGLSVFETPGIPVNLELTSSESFECGIKVLSYGK